ncbi:MAG: hypothetical protein ABFR36_06710 [Acidobacteriota bacterium]
MNKWKILMILVMLFIAVPLISEEKKPVILAEHFETQGDYIFYSGKVEVITEQYKIFADYVKYNSKTKNMVAEGRVTITSDDMSVSGGEFRFNMDSMTGEMYDVQGMMEPSVSYSVEKLVQVDKEVQRFSKMKFTSCTQLVPRWLITSRKGKIVKDKYIEMKGVLLKIKKIPVLYLPYLRYPIKDGKSSGLLFPVIGTSERLGFFMKNSFFWDIKPNLDLTISYDHISKIGTGAELDLRYLFKSSEGNIKFYYFGYSEKYNETLEDDALIKERDYNINLKHLQRISFLNTKIRANVNYQSNPEFQSIFNKDYGRYNLSRFNSNLAVESSIKNLSLSIAASRNETFYVQRNTSNVITKFPSVTLSLKQQKIWKLPGYFSMKSSFESIQRSGIDYEEEDLYLSDVRSDRFSLIPSYTLNIMKLSWMTATADFQSKHSYYLKSKDPVSNEIIDEPLHLNYNTAKLTIKGPSFYKIFETRSSRIKHLIEPEIKFSYSTKVDDAERERIIPIDRFDYPLYSFVSFTLNSRLFKKSKKEDKSPYEFFTYTLSQKFYLDPEIASRYRTIEAGEELIYPEFSELTNSFRYKPSKYISLELNLAYNYYLKKFQKANLTLGYSNRESPVYGRITYSKYFNPFRGKDFFLNTELLRGDINLDLPVIPLKVQAAVDYDFFNKRFRYGSIVAAYNYQCLDFTAEMKIYTLSNGATDLQYTIGVNFGNLGMVKDFFGVDNK